MKVCYDVILNSVLIMNTGDLMVLNSYLTMKNDESNDVECKCPWK